VKNVGGTDWVWFDGKTHVQSLVDRCEVCLHIQLTDSPQTLNLRTESSSFRNTVFFFGILDGAQNSSYILKIYRISMFL
jgi:hypothetical protein